MSVDPYILCFSAITVGATIWMGFWSAKRSKTAGDFFVAGRSVSVGWNASAISGEYLSAASFMGVAGMVMSSGYDALWYPVCYACGYLFLLLFIAGPLRRFGAYTIPDFAEGRYDSPVFRKIAVVFVLFIGFFYTMPQMKGAGTTLAYIFPGLPYWAGVVLVGAVITFNVALGGMKGITLVQAFQYWAKMFAISVPIFVLMAVYGHYGHHLGTTATASSPRVQLPAKAPADSAWLNPFGPLTTKAAKAAAAAIKTNVILMDDIALPEPAASSRGVFKFVETDTRQVLEIYAGLTGRTLLPREQPVLGKLDRLLRGQLTKLGLVQPPRYPFAKITANSAEEVTGSELKKVLESGLATNGISLVAVEGKYFRAVTTAELGSYREDLAKEGQERWLQEHQRPLALLYTYSLIIALVCGTAGLPHILVRFYTNPDGVAAKRTTMWVMILIGVFYLFPPMFGVLGRNLMPDLYNGLAGVKGTDGIVLRLPTILSERFGPLGSILSGVTCAGAFAAFMSTFSGLLVSMTGALAHDVYGRMLRPHATAEQRLRAFKIAAVLVGAVAVLLGTLVENFEINFMVGQAFAIAASSYFPLLFMSVWWRSMTMKGAAAGMLTGGLLALIGISLTSYTTFVMAMASRFQPETMPLWVKTLKAHSLETFWAAHPLLRILCEQPAIWAVPLAITLMVVISKLTATAVPADIRMKMLVLHAPEKLGLKQEYIQEHHS